MARDCEQSVNRGVGLFKGSAAKGKMWEESVNVK